MPLFCLTRVSAARFDTVADGSMAPALRSVAGLLGSEARLAVSCVFFPQDRLETSMSDTSPFGFERFVPGFDFLQNLAKGATGGVSSMPGLGNWIAPTMQVEDLQKRIDELKAVQFWLEQNSRALTATVQALEVQKMTLSTLKGMNVSMGDLASAFQRNATEALQKVTEAPAKPETAAPRFAFASPPSAALSPAAQPTSAPGAESAEAAETAEVSGASGGLIDPLQWWGALTTQFQQIAANALKDTAAQTSALGGTAMASDLATEALKTATGMATQLASQGMQTMEAASKQVQRAAATATPRKASNKTAERAAGTAETSAPAKAPRRSSTRKTGE